ncbi:zyg-11-like protein [Labeo rohita]|uniref:Zyg-11-like protein n=1 Tax=Labeo rohita TaxID=84645 RepID=A0A498M0A9_LABRO|nr:zyg-11-like protein [Labeo rohita]
MACVCHNVEVLCFAQEDGSLQFHHCPLFPQELADQLLRKMADEGVLNDRTVGIFQNLQHLRLRRAYIQSSQLSAEAFRRSLCPHKLQELNASHIHSNITVSDVLHSLTSNKLCRQGLQTLHMDGLRLYGEAGEESLQASFSMLRGLKKLSLAWTDLDDKGLEDISTMPMLESLDISGTNVTDFTPLLNCQSRLMSLTAHGLQKLEMPTSSFILVLSKLQSLRYLDISNDRLVMDGDNLVQQLLEHPGGMLPQLVSLDVSGWRGVSDATVQAFVEARPGLRFIGLLATGAGGSELLCGEEHLKLVLAGMRQHADSLHVQLVASACVFNLTIQELVLGMPLRLLGNVIQQLLTAMKNFPNHEQLQKNCLLTLCSDHILQVVPFDRYEAAKLIMVLLGNHADQTVQRMAVAVVSILVSKLVLAGMRQHADSLHVQLVASACVFNLTIQELVLGMPLRLLGNVIQQLLTAMKNFPNHEQLQKNCLLTLCSDHILQVVPFDRYEAAKLIMVLLGNHADQTVQRMAVAVVSILVSKNNVAEVEELRVELMNEDLVEHILSLLINPVVEVNVSYFAGGILAHLVSVRGPVWSLDAELLRTVQEKLHSSVLSWSSPDHAMVSYRTFQPFYPLLHVSQCSGVQLWALWAIQFVCSQNAPQYCNMLQSEGGTDILRILSSHPDTHSDVKCLTENILKILERNLHPASSALTEHYHHAGCPCQYCPYSKDDKTNGHKEQVVLVKLLALRLASLIAMEMSIADLAV